jgi:hypothetical protein
MRKLLIPALFLLTACPGSPVEPPVERPWPAFELTVLEGPHAEAQTPMAIPGEGVIMLDAVIGSGCSNAQVTGRAMPTVLGFVVEVEAEIPGKSCATMPSRNHYRAVISEVPSGYYELELRHNGQVVMYHQRVRVE